MRGPLVAISAVLGAAAVAAAMILASPTAVAADDDGYASWTFTRGTPSTGTMGLPPGFPATTFTSTTRTTAASPISSGATVYQPTGTPFADRFGPSRGDPYLSIRPAADGSPDSPSDTVYRFASATPVGDWGFTLGDVDAETVTVTGTRSDGAAASPADLGFSEASLYNYCAASPKPGGCGTLIPVPTAHLAATSVSVGDDGCPAVADRCDTDGESVWFEPTVPLSSLTITSTWKQGFPSYQTWFAARSAPLTGTVDSTCPSSSPTSVDLVTSDGTIAASAAVASGAYSFPRVVARDDYRVQASAGSLPEGVTVAPAAVDTSTGQTVVPPLTAVTTVTVRGVLSGPSDLVAGRVVELTDASGARRTTTTAEDGSYAFSSVPSGDASLSVVSDGRSVTAPTTTPLAVGCTAVEAPPIRVAAASRTPTPSPSPDPTPSASPTAGPPSGGDAGAGPGAPGGPAAGDLGAVSASRRNHGSGATRAGELARTGSDPAGSARTILGMTLVSSGLVLLAAARARRGARTSPRRR